MNFFAIQATYDELQIGLGVNAKLLSASIHDKKQSSTVIITAMQKLLCDNSLQLSDISFIGINQGPAPFTSLRTAISTVNGLSFATSIPLVGIDGLQAFMSEYENPQWPYTMILLNAYNNDVYYALKAPEIALHTGYKNGKELIAELSLLFPTQQFRCMGNATDFMQSIDKHRFFIPDPCPHYPSLEHIADTALQQWREKKNVVQQVLPLYLKTMTYKKSIGEDRCP